jgi:MFS family permease
VREGILARAARFSHERQGPRPPRQLRPVGVGEEDVLAVVAALGDVMRHAWDYNADDPRYAREHTAECYRGQKQVTVPILARFTVLRGAMPELWVTFAVKFLGVAAYAVMNSTLVLWLSSDLGYSDEKALGLVGAWAVLMTVCTILVGSLTDALGMRKTFLLGVVICVIARCAMTFTTVKWLALGVGLFPLALGEALGTPVMVAAIRRYSTTAQRAISFSMFYVMMNLGFLVQGFIFDGVRGGLGEYGRFTLPLVGTVLSTYQTLFLVSLLLELVLLPILYFGIREGAEAGDEGVPITPGAEQPVDSGARRIGRTLAATVRTTLRDTGRNMAALSRQPGFYRLLTFLMLIAGVKFVYMTMNYAYPKFGIRELGAGAPLGRLWSVTNSALIIVLVPIVGALSQRISAYRMVTLGCSIVAASVFVLALPTTWFQGMADGWFGWAVGQLYLGLKGSVNPWYLMLFLFIVLYSLGEAFYSPRVYEYAAAIAPRGQEASYGALSYVPMFLAKLFVGTFSGMLLARYCPASGPRNAQMMWLVIGLIAVLAPLGLLVLRRVIRVREAGREE